MKTRQRKCILYTEDLGLQIECILFGFILIQCCFGAWGWWQVTCNKIALVSNVAPVNKDKVSLARRKRAVKTSLIRTTEIDMKNGLIIMLQNVDANNLCLMKKKKKYHCGTPECSANSKFNSGIAPGQLYLKWNYINLVRIWWIDEFSRRWEWTCIWSVKFQM